MDNQQSLVERLRKATDVRNDHVMPHHYLLLEAAKCIEALEAQLKPQDELPELPKPTVRSMNPLDAPTAYTADQMRAYGQLYRTTRPTDAQPQPQKADCHESCGYIGSECDFPHCKPQTQPVSKQEPVARLQEYVSDRPYSEGKKFFDIVILDHSRCFDGMELFTDPQGGSDGNE